MYVYNVYYWLFAVAFAQLVEYARTAGPARRRWKTMIRIMSFIISIRSSSSRSTIIVSSSGDSIIGCTISMIIMLATVRWNHTSNTTDYVSNTGLLQGWRIMWQITVTVDTAKDAYNEWGPIRQQLTTSLYTHDIYTHNMYYVYIYIYIYIRIYTLIHGLNP